MARGENEADWGADSANWQLVSWQAQGVRTANEFYTNLKAFDFALRSGVVPCTDHAQLVRSLTHRKEGYHHV